jgi:ectoine hydroxylase-related dioxygenase (phytanoyl-CoA dioxygenase family)
MELDNRQRELFATKGYLAFTDVLTPQEVADAREGLTELVQRVAHDPTTVKKGPFWSPQEKRIVVQFEDGYEPAGADDAELELKVRKLMYYQEEHPHFAYLANQHPKILAILADLLRENPLLYADQAMIKPAHIGREKPWHQDNAYFSVTPLEAICGVWIALEDATVENGCMHVLAGQHKRGALRHHHTYDCEIMPDRIDPALAEPVELPAGGAMFFSGMLPHQTPPNTSSQRRRALQFHYRAAGSAIVEKEAYFKIFAEADGTPASCAAASRKTL